jgi:hypothetical protein
MNDSAKAFCTGLPGAMSLRSQALGVARELDQLLADAASRR